MIHRPRFRIPILVAVAIVAATYVLRSVVMRDFDFSLDLPADAIAFTAFAIAIALVAWYRGALRQGEGAGEAQDGSDGESGEPL